MGLDHGPPNFCQKVWFLIMGTMVIIPIWVLIMYPLCPFSWKTIFLIRGISIQCFLMQLSQGSQQSSKIDSEQVPEWPKYVQITYLKAWYGPNLKWGCYQTFGVG